MSNFLWGNHRTSFGSLGGSGGKATDSDDEVDDFLDSDDGEEAGLEMEDLLLHTPIRGQRTTQRSDSGSNLLLRRSNTPSSSTPAGGPCDSGSRKIARAGRIAARRVFSRNRRVSIWLLVMLLMVIISISMNAFEGTYISSIFGKSADKDDKFDGPPGQVSAGGGLPISGVTIRTPIAVPITAPVTPQPHLSVHEHKAASLNHSTPHNTFTTWLDFDDRDPPKRNNFPQPRDGQAFCNQWCDLRGGVTWYPDDNGKQSWQRRAPAFLLPGALYSGTVYLAAALHRHPSVLPARTKELQFFHERPFRRYVSPQEKTLVQAARERMHARDYNTTALAQNKKLVSFDASPGYLFYSSLLPRRILCVEPWVKLVLMLRNPVDRVLEHYAAMLQRGLKLTLEAWIDKEFALMEKVGLIQNATSNDDGNNNKFYGSKEEDVAWYDYQTASVGGAIGRSMYVLQIRHWVQALRAVGRSPDQEILIVRTDHVAIDPNVEYQRVLRFLQLPVVPLHDSKSLPPLTVTHQTRPVAPATRQRLEEFFRPYNRRLKRLLRQHGISSSAQDDNFPEQ